jgi:hypothetical protein
MRDEARSIKPKYLPILPRPPSFIPRPILSIPISIHPSTSTWVASIAPNPNLNPSPDNTQKNQSPGIDSPKPSKKEERKKDQTKRKEKKQQPAPTG